MTILERRGNDEAKNKGSTECICMWIAFFLFDFGNHARSIKDYFIVGSDGFIFQCDNFYKGL